LVEILMSKMRKNFLNTVQKISSENSLPRNFKKKLFLLVMTSIAMFTPNQNLLVKSASQYPFKSV